mmetsp:Transcript_27647/g.74919  ORF Transcript_27647/g.74919 Transcript_27647/m.74919 type:complete len:282 (+) Transcript_27647:1052-1897(+)
MVMSNKGTVHHRTKGATSSTKQMTDIVAAAVAMARYVGRALITSIARPNKDSAVEHLNLTVAALFFADATTVLPTRSCHTVASPMPPVRRGTRRSAEASPSTKGAAAPAVVAATAGSRTWSRGTPRAATLATRLPKRPRPPMTVSMVSCWKSKSDSSSGSFCTGVLPKFVTVTLRLTPSDCETMPNSAATKWTFRRLSLFSILKSRWAPTGSSSKLDLMRWVKLSLRKTSPYTRCSSRVVEDSASCFLGLLRPVVWILLSRNAASELERVSFALNNCRTVL